MPAAPATHPKPKIGTRRMFAGSFMRLMSRASIEGLEMPVTEVKNSAPRELDSRPA